MTTQIKVTNLSGKNAVIQLYVDGAARKNKKSDPILLPPGKDTDLTVWPGIAFEVKEEQQDEEISSESAS